MAEALERWLAEAWDGARPGAIVQELWSGYGAVQRVHGSRGPAILKRVTPPSGRRHPRGWATARGHARKLRSYDVELAFYRTLASEAPRVPILLAGAAHEAGWWLLLEDLDAAGFAERRDPSPAAMHRVLAWLARFHATFLGRAPTGLWETGTYWHLATRPDEWAAMPSGPLKDAAAAIDARLSGARFQTVVHGDAKLANFCFGPAGVAAVDFQYAGGGVGIKDVVYYLGSVLSDDALVRSAPRWLDVYFERLAPRVPDGVVREWRELVPLAEADFARFLQGWAPDHGKLGRYSAAAIERALAMV